MVLITRASPGHPNSLIHNQQLYSAHEYLLLSPRRRGVSHVARRNLRGNAGASLISEHNGNICLNDISRIRSSGRTSPSRVYTSPPADPSKILRNVPSANTRTRVWISPSRRSHDVIYFPAVRARARAPTLPFVYAHKYSFKPPPWYLDEAIRLSSLIRDHQSSPDRQELSSKNKALFSLGG